MDPARARAGSTLYRSFILGDAQRAGKGFYRGTRLRAPTLSLYGRVLYGNNDPTRRHPEILDGYADYADDFSREHVPGTGYYIAEERPDIVVDRTLEFLSAGRAAG